ncbi:MAG: hypothetical protein LHV69_02365 [Elusimicrobia bacterium]|nr:hypothetical protein [Candidatus Obscuribacterium magneticum]MCB4755869.1 hypothetical protein [Candidatus Obscuribacterium magneticum]
MEKDSSMNSDLEKWIEKQARWQQSRRALSWPEKIRLAEQIRDSIGRWSQSAVRKAGMDLSHTRTKKEKS